LNIFVENLNSKISEAQLLELFSQYGTVRSVSIAMDRFSGHSKGFAFVEMEDDAQAAFAIRQLNNFNFMNQYLELKAIRSKPGS